MTHDDPNVKPNPSPLEKLVNPSPFLLLGILVAVVFIAGFLVYTTHSENNRRAQKAEIELKGLQFRNALDRANR